MINMNKILLNFITIIFTIANLQTSYVKTTEKKDQNIFEAGKIAGIAGGGTVIAILIGYAIKSLFDNYKSKELAKSEFIKNLSRKELKSIPEEKINEFLIKIGNAILSGDISASDIRLIKNEAVKKDPDFGKLHDTLEKVITKLSGNIAKDFNIQNEGDRMLYNQAIFDAIKEASGINNAINTNPTFKQNFEQQIVKPLQGEGGRFQLIPEHTQLVSLIEASKTNPVSKTPVETVEPIIYWDPGKTIASRQPFEIENMPGLGSSKNIGSFADITRRPSLPSPYEPEIVSPQRRFSEPAIRL